MYTSFRNPMRTTASMQLVRQSQLKCDNASTVHAAHHDWSKYEERTWHRASKKVRIFILWALSPARSHRHLRRRRRRCRENRGAAGDDGPPPEGHPPLAVAAATGSSAAAPPRRRRRRSPLLAADLVPPPPPRDGARPLRPRAVPLPRPRPRAVLAFPGLRDSGGGRGTGNFDRF